MVHCSPVATPMITTKKTPTTTGLKTFATTSQWKTASPLEGGNPNP